MARSRAGSSELLSLLEQEVVKMQWCILYELWRKKQSMLVSGKLCAIRKRNAQACAIRVARAYVLGAAALR